MAGTPLTDSIEALTTYANQTTGASDTNLSDAVYTLVQGYGGGGVNPPLVVEEVIVGENTVSNMIEAHNYFYSTPANNQILLLKDSPTVLKQLTNLWAYYINNTLGGQGLRWGGTNVQPVPIHDTFDAVLVSGTTYYKIYLP